MLLRGDLWHFGTASCGPQPVALAVHLKDVGSMGPAVEHRDREPFGLKTWAHSVTARLLLMITLPCSSRARKAWKRSSAPRSVSGK